MVTQVGYSVVRRLRGQVKLCAVCIVHMETRSTGLLVDDEDIPTFLPSFIDDIAGHVDVQHKPDDLRTGPITRARAKLLEQ
jgi:hypothetical protein